MLRPFCTRRLVTLFRAARNASMPAFVTAARPKIYTRPSSNLQPVAFRLYSSDAKWTNEAFDNIIKKDKIVVFMKGTPEAPMCGFSKAVVTIFQMHGIVDITAFNVLEDDELRQKVKDFSNWPTIPQVYINGEFVGGCDIMIQLHQNGELITELEKVGFRSILSEAAD
eukprot:gene3218-1535_t